MKVGLNRGFLLALLIASLCFMGCASFKRGMSKLAEFAGADTEKGQVTQAELQDDLLRFESQFNAKIENANRELEESADPDIRYRASINRLVYSSNSLNIALGPDPESNLLDMVTFIELSHDALRDHWIPSLFKENGIALDKAFEESKQQIWGIAEKVLTEEQKTNLRNVISSWRSKHPDQINVETVRLSAFSTEAGAKAAGLDESIGGLFASVQQSTEAVDSATLFAERALYFSERLPFLLRQQARLGVHEIIEDTSFRFAETSGLLGDRSNLNRLLKEFQQTALLTQAMLGEANMAVKNVSTLMDRLSRGRSGAGPSQASLGQITSLLKELNQLMSSDGLQEGISKTATILDQLERARNRQIEKLAWLGAGLIMLFWAMFVVAKLTYKFLQYKLTKKLESPSQGEQKNKAA